MYQTSGNELYLRASGLLGEELEDALLGLVAERLQALERLLARLHLLAAHDVSALVEEEIRLGQAARSALGGAVEDLRLGSDLHLAALHHLALRLTLSHALNLAICLAGILAGILALRLARILAGSLASILTRHVEHFFSI